MIAAEEGADLLEGSYGSQRFLSRPQMLSTIPGYLRIPKTCRTPGHAP